MSFHDIKIFPWINRSEFRRVYRELYSDSVSLQKHALGRVSVWKARVNNLPVAVDLTAELVKCSISDEEIKDRGVVAQSLGFMIMKFVNNITEERQQTVKRKSVAELATEIGIDKSIVNLRHDVAHNVMPSIHVLQAALRYSLNWLKTNFWEIQMRKPDLAPTRANQKLSLLRDLLDQYKLEMFRKQSGKKKTEIHELKQQLEQSFRHLGEKCFPLLVETGNFIFTLDQLTGFGLSHKDIMTETHGIPDELYTIWKPVLDILGKLGLMPGFLLYIAYVLTQDSSYTNRILYGWMYMILTAFNPGKIFLPYKQLLDLTIQIVNEYAPPVLFKLIELVDERYLPIEKKDKLSAELEKLYASIGKNEEEVNTDFGDQTDTSREENQLENKHVWNKCMQQIHWLSQPFGLLPNQSISYKNLELDWSGFDEEEVSWEPDCDNDMEEQVSSEEKNSEIDKACFVGTYWNHLEATLQDDSNEYSQQRLRRRLKARSALQLMYKFMDGMKRQRIIF